MKTYTHCTLQDDKVLWWYKTLDWEGDLQNDFDVLEWWKIYTHETTGAYMVDYTPVWYCIWSYRTQEEALQAICDRKNNDEKRWELIEKAQSKFVWVSLDEAYKDVNPAWTKQKKEVKTLWYIENLMNKAKERTKEMHMAVEQVRINRNWKLWNAEYINALIEH